MWAVWFPNPLAAFSKSDGDPVYMRADAAALQRRRLEQLQQTSV